MGPGSQKPSRCLCPHPRLFYTRLVTAAIIDDLRRALETRPPLRLAILSGSAARGELRADSDLDVGIVPRTPELPLTAGLDLHAHLMYEKAGRKR